MIFNPMTPLGGGSSEPATHTVTTVNGGTGRGLYVPTASETSHGTITSLVFEPSSHDYMVGEPVIVARTNDWAAHVPRSTDGYTYFNDVGLGKVGGYTLTTFVMPDMDVIVQFVED